MDSVRVARDPASVSVVAIGFGTAVAMWALGYVGRLPAVLLPSPLLLLLLLACLLGGGIALGRYAGFGWRAGAKGIIAPDRGTAPACREVQRHDLRFGRMLGCLT